MHLLNRLVAKEEKLVIGLMSGTSLDGVDAALVKVTGFGETSHARLVGFQTTPYTVAERAAIHALIEADTPALSAGNFALGAHFADAALALLDKLGLRPDEVDLVGSHGQTVWHQPPSSLPKEGGTASTLQLGEPAVIAARTGLVTVGNFRVADLAVGGEGAPLVPWCDWVLYRRPGTLRALQNIGGIANVTLVGDDRDSVLAFDNAPGNVMIDAWAQHACGQPFDEHGALSARGRVQEDLLAFLLDDDYLRRPPPKSTGRERYGRARTLDVLRAYQRRDPLDVLATLVAFTAHAIAQSYRTLLPRLPDEVLVSGGGAHNRTLMYHLGRLLHPIPVRAFADDGVSADAKEAVCFAVLAVAAVHGVPANLPAVTGASRRAILGQISLPP